MPSAIGDEKFKYVVRALLTVLEYENQGKAPTISELIETANLNKPLFHSHLKRNLESAGWVEFRVNPDRTVTAHLTERGRKIAKALKTVEKELKEAGVI